MYLVLVLYNKTTYLKTKNLTGFRKSLIKFILFSRCDRTQNCNINRIKSIRRNTYF